MRRRRRAGSIGPAFLLIAASAVAAWGQAKTPAYVFWPMKKYPLISYSGRIIGTGAAAGGRYVFATSASLVYAVDLAPLEALWQSEPRAKDPNFSMSATAAVVAWQFKTKAPVSTAPVFAGALAIVVDDTGEVYALNDKGQPAWTVATGEPPHSGPVALGERVLLHRRAGNFTVLDGKTGKAEGPLMAEGELVDAWCAAEGKLFTVTQSGAIVVLGPDGREVDRIKSEVPYRGPLAISDDTLLVGKDGGVVESFNRKTRKPNWSRRLGTPFRALAFMGAKRVCALGTNDVLFCLVRRSGDLRWWRGGEILETPAPIFWQGRILGSFGTSEMFGLVDRTGESRYRFDVGTKIVGDFHIWGGNLVVHMYNAEADQGLPAAHGPRNQGQVIWFIAQFRGGRFGASTRRLRFFNAFFRFSPRRLRNSAFKIYRTSRPPTLSRFREIFACSNIPRRPLGSLEEWQKKAKTSQFRRWPTPRTAITPRNWATNRQRTNNCANHPDGDKMAAPGMAQKRGYLIDFAGLPALVRGYAFVLAGNGAAGLLSFLIFVRLSRTMSLEGFGSFALFFTVMTLVWQIPGFIDSAYVRYARAAPPAEARVYLRVNLAYKIRTGAWIAALSPAAAFALARWVFPGKTTFGLLVMAILAGAFLTFLASVIADLQAREAYAGYAIGTVSFYAVALAILFFLSRGGRILAPAAAGIVLAAGAAAAGSAALAWLDRRARPIFPLDPEAAGRVKSLGKWILATSLLYVVLQRIDMLVVGHYFAPAELGLYTAASRLLSALTIFLSAASALYLPKAALAPSSRRALHSYLREAGLLAAALLLILAGLVVAAPYLAAFFFGPSFAGSAAATRTLFLGHVPLVFALPFSYLLYGLEDSFSNFLAMALCLAANIGANAVLTPRLGITGPGWAFGVGYAVYLAAVLAALFLRKSNRSKMVGARMIRICSCPSPGLPGVSAVGQRRNREGGAFFHNSPRAPSGRRGMFEHETNYANSRQSGRSPRSDDLECGVPQAPRRAVGKGEKSPKPPGQLSRRRPGDGA